MKTRFVFSAFCMLVAMTMATGAFAQGIFTVSGGIEPRGRENGHAELAGGVTLFLSSGEITEEDEGTVVIDYGVDITNGVDPVADMDGITVNICNATEAPMDDSATADVLVDGSTLTISLDNATCGPGTGASARINVDGVLLSLVGSGASSIMASVTATGAMRLPGGVANRVTVIENVVDPLEDENVKVGQKVTLIRHEGEPKEDDPSVFHLVITEPHVDSFDGAQLELKFSGIPDDVNIEDLDAWVTTKKDFDNSMTDTDVLGNQIPVGAPNMRVEDVDEDGEATVYLVSTGLPGINLNPGDDPDAGEDDDFMDPGEIAAGMGGTLTGGIDVVVIRGSIVGADAEELLPIDLTIDVAVDLGPIGDDDGAEIPRFASDRTTPLTVIDSSSAQITMNVAYVLSEGEYDTGIAVSNMTKDQAGAVHFAFFMNGQELKYSTPAMLAPQSTITVLLSELLTAAEHTGSFSGYMTITADFTEGNGVAYISDFTAFTSASPVTTVVPMP